MNVLARTAIGLIVGAVVGFLLVLLVPTIPVTIPFIGIFSGALGLIGALLGASIEKLGSAFQKVYDKFLDWRVERVQIRPELEERRELQRAGREAIKEARKTRKATKKLVGQQEKSLKVIDRIVKKVEAGKEKEAQEQIDQLLAEAAETVKEKQGIVDATLLRDIIQKAEALKKVRFNEQKRQRALQDLRTAITNLQQAPQPQAQP